MTQISLTIDEDKITSTGMAGNNVTVATRIDDVWVMDSFIDSHSLFVSPDGINITDAQYREAMVADGYIK